VSGRPLVSILTRTYNLVRRDMDLKSKKISFFELIFKGVLSLTGLAIWILISDNYPTTFSVIGFPIIIILGLAIGELNETLKKKYGEYSSVLCMFFLWGLVAIGNILIQII